MLLNVLKGSLRWHCGFTWMWRLLFFAMVPSCSSKASVQDGAKRGVTTGFTRGYCNYTPPKKEKHTLRKSDVFLKIWSNFWITKVLPFYLEALWWILEKQKHWLMINDLGSPSMQDVDYKNIFIERSCNEMKINLKTQLFFHHIITA